MIQKLSTSYGHRGLWLMTMGLIWVVFGIGALIDGALVPDRPYVAHDLIPHDLQATAWVITGGLAIVYGHRGPGKNDAVGHVALYIVPAVWTASFAASWIVYVSTSILTALGAMRAPEGFDRGWYSALIWAVIVVMIRLVSSWANPSTAMIPAPRLPGPSADAGRHTRTPPDPGEEPVDTQERHAR